VNARPGTAVKLALSALSWTVTVTVPAVTEKTWR
jgi:hypothetical protein